MMPTRTTAAALALTAALAGPAATQPYDNYPVCLRQYGPVYFNICRYTSIAQCRADAAGRSGDCYTNPWYSGPAPQDRPARRARRAR